MNIEVSTIINSKVERVWKTWNEPKDIMSWYYASDDWTVLHATNDLKVGGKFIIEMSAVDRSVGFDFNGVYTRVELMKVIEYTIEGGRKVKIEFTQQGDKTKIVESFEPENENSEEMQRKGWQAILDNFKKYVEGN